VATDADPAGQRAAHRAFWQLAARAEDPRQLRLPDGTDPAEYLQTHGPAALRAALENAVPLAEQVTAARTAPFAHRLDSNEGRIAAMRVAADVIGARPPDRWLEAAPSIAERFQVAAETVVDEVLDAGHAWGSDSRGLVRARLAERPPDPLPAAPPDPAGDPQQRWAPLVASFAGDLTGDPHWPVLAAHIDRAAATGYDVTHRLLVLTAQRPLDPRHRARDLDLRLTADHPDCLPPADPAHVRDDQAHAEQAAARRMATADRHTAHQRTRGPQPGPDRTAPRGHDLATTPAPPGPPPPDRRPTPPGPRHRP
jgi:DNA primase